MARAIAAGQLGVAREAEAVVDQGGNEAADASEDRSGAAEREDPDVRLARALAERMAEKGKAGEAPSAQPAPEHSAAEDDVSQDIPAGASGAGPAVQGSEPSMYEPYSVSAHEASESPPEKEPSMVPERGRTGWRARGKRVLNALGAPFKAFGAAIKSAFKGGKGKEQGATPTAAQTVTDAAPAAPQPASDELTPEELALPFPSMYWSYAKTDAWRAALYGPQPGAADPNALAAPQPASDELTPEELALESPSGYWSYTKFFAWKEAREGRLHPLAAGVNAPAPAATKYANLSPMGLHHVNEHVSSADFINIKLLGVGALADDMHRFGLIQSSEQATVQNDPDSVREGLKKVWGWTDEEVRKYYDASTGKATNSKVDYIGSEQDLKKFVVRAGATLQYGDPPQPFDTSGMLSKASGAGFAIFVMDAEGNIYAGQHRVGLFHHSSFLAGRAVAAAGEMKVSGGTLVELTGKSGHYAPTDDQMHQMLQELAGAGVVLAGVSIKLWTNVGGRYVTQFYDAADFLANKRAATMTGQGSVF